MKKNEKKIKYFFGYRTQKSIKDIENWNIANRYSPTSMIISIVVLGLLPMFFKK